MVSDNSANDIISFVSAQVKIDLEYLKFFALSNNKIDKMLSNNITIKELNESSVI
jgi:hypothetical protein